MKDNCKHCGAKVRKIGKLLGKAKTVMSVAFLVSCENCGREVVK